MINSLGLAVLCVCLLGSICVSGCILKILLCLTLMSCQVFLPPVWLCSLPYMFQLRLIIYLLLVYLSCVFLSSCAISSFKLLWAFQPFLDVIHVSLKISESLPLEFFPLLSGFDYLVLTPCLIKWIWFSNFPCVPTNVILQSLHYINVYLSFSKCYDLSANGKSLHVLT